MIENVRLYLEAVGSSALAVVGAGGAVQAEPGLATWLFGGGGALALVTAVYAYGQLVGRVAAHDDRLQRIEQKLDQVIPKLAVVADRTEA